MSADLFVATLIAPAGAALSQADIQSVIDRATLAGGRIEKTILLNDRAADLFFTGAALTVNDLPFDVIVQPATTRRKKILVADMESTIIEQEMLDELAHECGVGDRVAAITRRAMNGELDFAAALAERVGLLRGQPESLLEKVAKRMTLMPGAAALVAAMKRSGAECWLVSGGFTYFVKKIADQLGFNGFYANELIVKNGVITGEIAAPILDKNSKKQLLEHFCTESGLALADALAVGDGANDIPMLLAAHNGGGLGVAYHAKPAVRAAVPSQINRSDLSALIYSQGL